MVLMVVLMPLSPLQFVRFSLVGIKVFSLPPILFSPLSPPAPLTFSIRHREKKKTFTVVVPSRIFLWKKIQGLFVYFYSYQSSFLCRKTNRPETHKLSVKAMKLLQVEQREAGLHPARGGGVSGLTVRPLWNAAFSSAVIRCRVRGGGATVTPRSRSMCQVTTQN